MISYQTTGPGSALVEVISATPVPKAAEVLLRVVACGVCHSDVHLHAGVFDLGGGKHLDVDQQRVVLGHEIFGEVVSFGSAVRGVKIGDRRVVYPWIGCGKCPSCQRGEEQLCTPGQALGIVKNGGFADHILVPDARYLFDKGSVADSLAATYACSGLTAYSAIKKLGKLRQGDEIVIIGAGGVGTMAIQIARAQGIDPIVVDSDADKLQHALEMGVKRLFSAADPDAAKAIRKASAGAYAVLDFVGAEASVNFGLSCLRKGGRLIIIGLYGGSLTIPIPFIPMNARLIQGSYVGSLEEMGELMALVRAGKIAPIEIQERPMAEANQALLDLKAGRVRGRQVLLNHG
jgi:D-arabinose 1-dehydrogenase-like Zn-dependent alcohol dehydrogenase